MLGIGGLVWHHLPCMSTLNPPNLPVQEQGQRQRAQLQQERICIRQLDQVCAAGLGGRREQHLHAPRVMHPFEPVMAATLHMLDVEPAMCGLCEKHHLHIGWARSPPPPPAYAAAASSCSHYTRRRCTWRQRRVTPTWQSSCSRRGRSRAPRILMARPRCTTLWRCRRVRARAGGRSEAQRLGVGGRAAALWPVRQCSSPCKYWRRPG